MTKSANRWAISVLVAFLGIAVPIAYNEYRGRYPLTPQPRTTPEPAKFVEPNPNAVQPVSHEEPLRDPGSAAIDVDVSGGKYFVDGRDVTTAEIETMVRNALRKISGYQLGIYRDASIPLDEFAANKLLNAISRLNLKPGGIFIEEKQPFKLP